MPPCTHFIPIDLLHSELVKHLDLKDSLMLSMALGKQSTSWFLQTNACSILKEKHRLQRDFLVHDSYFNKCCACTYIICHVDNTFIYLEKHIADALLHVCCCAKKLKILKSLQNSFDCIYLWGSHTTHALQRQVPCLSTGPAATCTPLTGMTAPACSECFCTYPAQAAAAVRPTPPHCLCAPQCTLSGGYWCCTCASSA